MNEEVNKFYYVEDIYHNWKKHFKENIGNYGKRIYIARKVYFCDSKYKFNRIRKNFWWPFYFGKLKVYDPFSETTYEYDENKVHILNNNKSYIIKETNQKIFEIYSRNDKIGEFLIERLKEYNFWYTFTDVVHIRILKSITEEQTRDFLAGFLVFVENQKVEDVIAGSECKEYMTTRVQPYFF